MTRRLMLSVLIALTVLLLAAPTFALIGRMDMDPGSSSSSGGGGMSLPEKDIQAIATFVTDLGTFLDAHGQSIAGKLGSSGPAEGSDCSAVREQFADLMMLAPHYRSLFTPEARENPAAAHGLYNSNTLWAELRRLPQPRFDEVIVELFCDYIVDVPVDGGIRKDCLQGPRRYPIGTPALLECAGGMETTEAAVTALSKGVVNNQPLNTLRRVPTAFRIVSPFEPFTPPRGTWGLTLEYAQFPFDRMNGNDLSSADDWASGRLEIGGGYAATDWLRISAQMPIISYGDVPAAVDPDVRGTGAGDLRLRADFWLNEMMANISKLNTGFGVWTKLDTGDPTKLTGQGATYLGLDGKLAYELRNGLRPHAAIGYRFKIATSDDALPIVDEGGAEVVVGTMWTTQPWHKADQEKRSRTDEIALWLDFAGTHFKDGVPDIMVEKSWLWDVRAGVSLLLGNPNSTDDPMARGADGAIVRPIRQSLALEFQWPLQDEGINSSVNWLLSYGFTY